MGSEALEKRVLEKTALDKTALEERVLSKGTCLRELENRGPKKRGL